MSACNKFGCLMATGVLLLNINTAHGQGLNDLLKSLSNIQLPGQPAQQQQTPQSSGKPNTPASLTERYCRNLFSVAALESNGPIDERLITEEFNVEPKDFYDEATNASIAKPGFSSYAFPSLSFYKSEFETNRINVLYDLFLTYPSPKYAAALINISKLKPGQPRHDRQEVVDAKVALAMIHYRMQDKSKSSTRWRELLTEIQSDEHYLGKVIWARLYASGEAGQKDTSKSIGYIREAFMYPHQYRESGSRKTMSNRNYGVRASQTMYEVFRENPNHPYRQHNLAFLQRYEQAASFKDGLPEVKAQIGPGLAEVEKSSAAAASKATLILSNATTAGNIQAQKTSLDSAMRTRLSDTADYNADTQTLATLARQLEKMDKLDDAQTKLLGEAMKHAHESGDKAISMGAQMLGVVMDVMNRRGIEAMSGVAPFAQRLQSYQDSACSVVSRLDHAAMTKKAVPVEPERSGLAAMMAEQ